MSTTVTATSTLLALTERLAPATLEETLAIAELQVRTDRKYIIPPQVLHEIAYELDGAMQVLQIGAERCFSYESVYFDTPELTSYLDAAHRRPSRFKVRTRTYVNSGECMLEVKTKGKRGGTVKERMPYAIGVRRHLTDSALRFIDERLHLPSGGRELEPVLTTSYRRATLLDRDAGTRMTVDCGLSCTDDRGAVVRLDDHLIVETKSAGAPTAVDRILWRRGHRPMSMSKYCIGIAALHPTLPANRWLRPMRRYFGVRLASAGA